jgi:hypothetical protein
MISRAISNAFENGRTEGIKSRYDRYTSNPYSIFDGSLKWIFNLSAMPMIEFKAWYSWNKQRPPLFFWQKVFFHTFSRRSSIQTNAIAAAACLSGISI